MTHLFSIKYPLQLKFKITTLANDFTVKDNSGKTIFYVREKLLKIRDHVKVYSNTSKEVQLYDLVSNKLIDFQQTFTITNSKQQVIGKVRKKTFQSFVKVTYNIQNPNGELEYTIREKSALVRFFDSIFGELPIIGFFSGYVFHPQYFVKDANQRTVMKLEKKPSFWGRKFTIEKLTSNPINEEQIILSLMLLILQQRSRG